MMRTTRKTRKRKRERESAGNDIPAPVRGVPAALLTLLALTGIALLLTAADKRTQQQSFALVTGTVFRDTGFTLGGAEVTLTPTPPEKPGEKPRVKMKPIKLASDPRGEFAFRVPAVPMRYNVSVRAAGFRAQQKPVSISGDERVDVYFRLEAEPKK